MIIKYNALIKKDILNLKNNNNLTHANFLELIFQETTTGNLQVHLLGLEVMPLGFIHLIFK